MEYVPVCGKYLSNKLISKIPAPAKLTQSRPRWNFKITVNPGPGKSIFLNTRPRHNFVPCLQADTTLLKLRLFFRLGANSLLDLVAFGRACAHTIKEDYTPGAVQAELKDSAGLLYNVFDLFRIYYIVYLSIVL